MAREVKLGEHLVGDGHPAYIVAEIGINHNGDIDMAKEMIMSAKDTGVDAIKLQKRTPELCVPKNQRDLMRETPGGISLIWLTRKDGILGRTVQGD